MARLLESLRDRPVGVEVLVVDNASADPEVRRLGDRFPGVRVISLESNTGYSRAVNLAARLAIVAVAVAAFVPNHAYDKKERIEEAMRLHDRKDYEGAMVIYREVLKDHPHDPTAVYELGFSWASSGKDLEGLAAFLEAKRPA